jgi:hypothetical protein
LSDRVPDALRAVAAARCKALHETNLAAPLPCTGGGPRTEKGYARQMAVDMRLIKVRDDNGFKVDAPLLRCRYGYVQRYAHVPQQTFWTMVPGAKLCKNGDGVLRSSTCHALRGSPGLTFPPPVTAALVFWYDSAKVAPTSKTHKSGLSVITADRQPVFIWLRCS